MKPADHIDDKINDFINRRVEHLQIEGFDEYFNKRKEISEDAIVTFTTSNIMHIHSNISSILTHISAMIAALGIILIAFEDSTITQLFIFVEIIIYTILALVCVYCLRYRKKFPFEGTNDQIDYLQTHYQTYQNRRYLFTACSNGVLINTVFFLITICAHALALVTVG